MSAAKKFAAGQAVEFIRDTDFGRPWEPGEYLAPAGAYMNGWHRVKARSAFGETFTVPARRLREAP